MAKFAISSSVISDFSIWSTTAANNPLRFGDAQLRRQRIRWRGDSGYPAQTSVGIRDDESAANV